MAAQLALLNTATTTEDLLRRVHDGLAGVRADQDRRPLYGLPAPSLLPRRQDD
jgi:hypothetical protein